MAPTKSKTQLQRMYNLRPRLTRLRSGMRTKAGGLNTPCTLSQSKSPVQRKLQRKKESRNRRPATDDNQSSDGMKCAICLDTERTKRMRYMPCGHSFHEKCCGRWLLQSCMCPVCRTPVIVGTPEIPFTPSSSTRSSRRPRSRRRRHVVIRQRFRDMLLSSTSVIIIDVYRFRPPLPPPPSPPPPPSS